MNVKHVAAAAAVVSAAASVVGLAVLRPSDDDADGGPAPSADGEAEASADALSDDTAIEHRVVATGPLGLFVRLCPDEDCGTGAGRFDAALGTAQEGSSVYVVCDAGVGYVPSGSPSASWYVVRWPNDHIGINTFLESTPDAPFEGYAYAQFLEPVSSDPVPPCDG